MPPNDYGIAAVVDGGESQNIILTICNLHHVMQRLTALFCKCSCT